MKKILSCLLILGLLLSFVPMLAEQAQPSGNFYNALSKGDRGEEVKRLQLALIDLGYLSGSADGIFGGKTEQAVEAFQKAMGLQVTRVADNPTLQLLYDVDSTGSADNESIENDERSGEAVDSEETENKQGDSASQAEATTKPSAMDFIDGETTIRELFPDANLAKIVRDALSKKSIDQGVTQEQLDTVTKIEIKDDVSDLTGISYLRNLTTFIVGCPFSMYTSGSQYGSEKSYYKGKMIPEEFALLSMLEQIKIFGGDDLVWPDSISNLTHLTTFIVENSYCSKLPEGLQYAKELTTLRCPATSIKQLPEWIGNLKNLRVLDIEYCKNITDLPEEIGQLTLLTDFKARSSGLMSLPDGFYNLISLVNVDCRNTGILSIQSNIENLIALESLNLSGTGITDLPEELYKLPNLSKLDISKTKMSNLPSFVYDLDSLTIDISETNIE